MTDQHDNEADERDDEDENERDSDAEVAAPKSRKAQPRAARGAVKPAPKAADSGSGKLVMCVVIALAAGGAGGWFGHIQQAKAALKADSAAAPAGSGEATGPCGVWQRKICSASGGDKSSACAEAKSALELMTPSTCEAALRM